MAVSWLWWAGQKLCGIVDQSPNGLYSPLLKLKYFVFVAHWFYKSPCTVFLWFGSRAKRAGSSFLASRTELICWLACKTSRAVTSRAGSISSPNPVSPYQRNNNLVSAHSGNKAVFDPMISGGVAHVSLSNRPSNDIIVKISVKHLCSLAYDFESTCPLRHPIDYIKSCRLTTHPCSSKALGIYRRGGDLGKGQLSD